MKKMEIFVELIKGLIAFGIGYAMMYVMMKYCK